MNKKRWLILAGCLALLLAGIGVRVYSDHYVFVAWESVSREAARVDLRGKDVSVDDFERLRSEIPDCDITWDVPFQGAKYPSTTEELQVSTLTEEDVAVLRYFPELKRLDALECMDYDQLLAVWKDHPDCSVEYRVPLGGNVYESGAKIVMIRDPDIAELMQMLPYLPRVVRVELSGQVPELPELTALRQAFPGVGIHWEISAEDRLLSTSSHMLDLSGLGLDMAQAEELLLSFPYGQTVDMRGCGLTDEEMMALADAYPEDDFLWDMTIGEVTVFTGAEEIDISGQVLESTEDIERLLPYFPNVKKVVMSHCGFDDETMDALNKRYEDIRFVWSVKIKNVYVRTDADYFYPFKFYREMTVNNDDLYPLRYCTDMVAIDIGHMSAVTDCEWAAFMPHLKYLILVETAITDLSPLSNCKELVYLEIFKTRITDYWPLVECTALEDLNLCRTYGDHTPIMQMTWLKNIWWNGILGTVGFPCSKAPEELPKALPNTHMVFNQQNSSQRNGWRDLDNYKAMRDVMGMFYLR